MADWDVFARITKRGMAVRSAVEIALGGRDFDENAVARDLDNHIARAGGLPSLGVALHVLQAAAAHHGARGGDAFSMLHAQLAALAHAARSPGTTSADLMLEASVRRAVFAGHREPAQVLAAFASDLLVRGSLDCKGGLIESVSPRHADSTRQQVRRLFDRVARHAAATLIERPDCKRLGLTKAFSSSIELTSPLLRGDT